MTKQQPTDVFLSLRVGRRKHDNALFHVAEWITAKHTSDLYRGKQCDTQEQAVTLARKWLAKQPEGRYRDVTRQPERFGYSHPAPKTPPGVNPSCDRCGRYNAMLSSYETSVNRIVVRCRDCGYAPDAPDAPRPWSFTQFYLGSVSDGPSGPTTIIECEPDDMRVLCYAASYEGTCGIAVDAEAFKRAGSIVVVDGRGNDRARFSRALAYAAQGFARFVHQAASAAPLIEEPASLTVMTLDTSGNVKQLATYKSAAAQRAVAEVESEPISIASAAPVARHSDALADVAAHVVAARGDVNVALTNASGSIEPRCAFVDKGRRCARVLFHEGLHSLVPDRGTSVLSDASILTNGAVMRGPARELHLDEDDRELPTLDARIDELSSSEHAAIVALVNHIASCSNRERAAIVRAVNEIVFGKGGR